MKWPGENGPTGLHDDQSFELLVDYTELAAPTDARAEVIRWQG